MLESYIRRRLAEKGILLMTHIVVGYPTLDASLELIRTMAAAGVDLMELQIPFSEPIADGPVILHANQAALAGGVTVRDCFDLAAEAARGCDLPLLFMSYYNILFKYGVARFAADMAAAGLRGAIIPDLPPEEGAEYLTAMAARQLAPIFIYSPTTTDRRMARIAADAGGFVYCVARKGVTGLDTEFSDSLGAYLARCRRATALPLAVGFGVKSREDIDFLRGRAEIAVIGTATIRTLERDGIDGVARFIGGLR